MKPTEAAALLTIAAAFDNRKPDEDQAKAWALALDGLRFEDCRDAIVEHYRRSREWLMPVEVVAGVKRVRDKRIAEFGPIPLPPGFDADDAAGYLRHVADMRRQIGDGTLTTKAPLELEKPDEQGEAVIAELGHIGQAVSDA